MRGVAADRRRACGRAEVSDNRWLPRTTCVVAPPDAQALFCLRRHQPRRPPIWISSGRATRSTMPWRFRHMDRLQMPNTINATNPMPTNSTTSATEWYSSQCRLPESMTFHPCFIDCENRSAVAPRAQVVFCRRRHQPRRPPHAKNSGSQVDIKVLHCFHQNN